VGTSGILHGGEGLTWGRSKHRIIATQIMFQSIALHVLDPHVVSGGWTVNKLN
jgi:hypothetical protein